MVWQSAAGAGENLNPCGQNGHCQADMKVLTADGRASAHFTVERLLLDAAQRSAGRPTVGRVAVVLHLSHLAPPAPRPHHRRIARALLQDTAARFDGQVFALSNGDLVLLCGAGASPAAIPGRGLVAEPAALPLILRKLLRVDTPPAVEIVSEWALATQSGSLLAYAQERMRRHGMEGVVVEDDFAAQTGMVDAIGALVGHAAIDDVIQRQTAVILTSGTGRHASPMQPLFRELTFSIAALESRIGNPGQVGADPFLFRHLAVRLDQRMLGAVCDALGRGGPLDLAGPFDAGAGPVSSAPPAFHLNITVPGLLSPAFAEFAAGCRRTGTPVGIEVSLIEAVADHAQFVRARALLEDAGLAFILDGVSHLSLLMSRPAALHPDMLKLDWSPRLSDLPPFERRAIEASLAEIGPDRIVLHRAETEQALQWGLAQGVRRFQGRHVDAMLGASRIVSCAHAAGCSLRQCIERASATGRVGRAGCHNTLLLDAADLHIAPGAPAHVGRGVAEIGA